MLLIPVHYYLNIERTGVNGRRFLYEFIVRAPFSRRIQKELLVIVDGHVIVRLWRGAEGRRAPYVIFFEMAINFK